jgi:hypothetical protein
MSFAPYATDSKHTLLLGFGWFLPTRDARFAYSRPYNSHWAVTKGMSYRVYRLMTWSVRVCKGLARVPDTFLTTCIRLLRVVLQS